MRQQKKVLLKPERFPRSPKEGLFVSWVQGAGVGGSHSPPVWAWYRGEGCRDGAGASL